MTEEGQAPVISLDVSDIAPSADPFGEEKVDLFADDASSDAGSKTTSDPPADDKSEEEKKAEADALEAGKKEAEEEAKAKEGEEPKPGEGEEEETPEQKAEREAAEAAAAEEEAKGPKNGEERKQQLNREIRDMVAQKNQLAQELAAINEQVYAAQTPEELVEAGVDPAEARIQSMEQREQLRDFNTHVADVNANLGIQSLQVMSDFPIFDPNSASYNDELSKKAKALYESVAGIETDEKTKLIIDVKVLPYNIYKSIAETYDTGTKGGQVEGQKATEKMLSNADPQSSSKKPEAPKKKDDFLTGLTKGLKIATK